MRSRAATIVATGALTIVVTAGCTAGRKSVPENGRRPAGGPPSHTATDVQFMSDMVAHHAQALLMTSWVPTHEASPPLRTMSERILVSQEDEIAFIQRWLRERNEPVPDADPSHATATAMDRGHHGTPMPGMLTAEELAQLDRARGPEFDRLFLTYMIQHHQGAVTMVQQLFSAPGAAQEDALFQFATDVSADQTAEIDRMRRVLETLSAGGE